jgi:hypothetical protein
MKILTILSICILSTVNAWAQKHVHLQSIKTIADKTAWATSLKNIQPAVWPYDILSIGHSMQSYQNYSMSPYWHDGLDIRGEAKQKVYATVAGKVVNIENYYPGLDLYWEVAILDDSGFVWKYHHVDKNSIPQEIRDAFKNGTRIQQGDQIGNIVKWGTTAYGEKYHHIHLLVVDGKGRYINPFKLLPVLADTSVPVIEKIGLFNRKRKIVSGNLVSGDHGIYIQAFDTVLHKKFNLTPYLITYSLDRQDVKTVWRFDFLPSSTNDIDYINDFYLRGTCGNYNCRKFNININFDSTAPKATRFFNLERGRHRIDIQVMDFVGNEASKSFEYTVN